MRFQEQTMKLNLLRSGWLQFNVHYYDRIKFKYGGDDEAIDMALEQLKEQAVESVPRELETFMFLNQLIPNKKADRSEVHQQSLLNIYEMVDSLIEEMISQVTQKTAEEGSESTSYTEDDVRQLIRDKKIYDWNPETVKKILSGQVSPSTSNKVD